MGRKSLLMSFAHLNDCKGDLSKNWYVEYSFRLPDKPSKKYVRRIYDGLCSGTDDERRAKAQVIVAVINDYLKSGEYLNHPADYTPIRESDHYRPEAQTFLDRVDGIRAKAIIARYLKSIKPTVRKKTYQDYSGKLYMFQRYVETELQNRPATTLAKKDILPFLEYLANDRGICRRSIEKYCQAIRALYTWMEDVELREMDTNPLKRIPKYGKVIDCKPQPFSDDDRTRLKNAISVRDPYLWLACEIQYYCAIRPGTELRLCKIGYIDRENHTITIPAEVAKAKRTDVVGIPPGVMAYMEKLGIFNYPEDYYIFGRYNVPSPVAVGKNTLRNRFNLYREELKISKNCKFYSWKHSGAISAANNGMPILELKDYLRHHDVHTTMQYLSGRIPTVGKQADYIDEI